MEKTISFSNNFKSDELQPFFKPNPMSKLDDFTKDEWQVIYRYLGEIQKFRFSYQGQDVVVLEKRKDELVIRIKEFE